MASPMSLVLAVLAKSQVAPTAACNDSHILHSFVHMYKERHTRIGASSDIRVPLQ